MESYSLLKVNEYISQVIALNFSETIWVDAEISQAKEVGDRFTWNSYKNQDLRSL
ncbi:MAG: hypothetical protein R2771_09900 [Saprospiraceae bacterium]